MRFQRLATQRGWNNAQYHQAVHRHIQSPLQPDGHRYYGGTKPLGPWETTKRIGSAFLDGAIVKPVKGVAALATLTWELNSLNPNTRLAAHGKVVRAGEHIIKEGGLLRMGFGAAVSATDQLLVYDNPLQAAEIAGSAVTGALATKGISSLVGRVVAAETIGPRIVSPRGFVELDEFSRLNVLDPAIGKLRPGEASAAVELQQVFGGRLERLAGPSGADFKFVSGSQAGKSVDFLLTPSTLKEAAGINQFFVKNADRFSVQLGEHLGKADIVPIDSRFLTPQNQKVLMDIVGRQSAANQSRIVIFR